MKINKYAILMITSTLSLNAISSNTIQFNGHIQEYTCSQSSKKNDCTTINNLKSKKTKTLMSRSELKNINKKNNTVELSIQKVKDNGYILVTIYH